jgi:hypothetical protein
MGCKRRRRCEYCQEIFRVDPRVGERHRACSREECQRARRRAGVRHWLAARPGYEGERVARWRRDHPKYLTGYRDRTPGLRERLREEERVRRADAARAVDIRNVISPQRTPEKGDEPDLAGVDIRNQISTEMLMLLGLIDVLRGVDVRIQKEGALRRS